MALLFKLNKLRSLRNQMAEITEPMNQIWGHQFDVGGRILSERGGVVRRLETRGKSGHKLNGASITAPGQGRLILTRLDRLGRVPS